MFTGCSRLTAAITPSPDWAGAPCGRAHITRGLRQHDRVTSLFLRSRVHVFTVFTCSRPLRRWVELPAARADRPLQTQARHDSSDPRLGVQRSVRALFLPEASRLAYDQLPAVVDVSCRCGVADSLV